jgi:putative transposase
MFLNTSGNFKAVVVQFMGMNDTHRKSMRLKEYDYTQVGGYFVTVVAFRRERIFGEIVEGRMILNPLGRIVQRCWEEIPGHFPQVTVDAFVVMPNHVHGILFLHEDLTHMGETTLPPTRRGEISLPPTRRGEIYLVPTQPGQLERPGAEG